MDTELAFACSNYPDVVGLLLGFPVLSLIIKTVSVVVFEAIPADGGDKVVTLRRCIFGSLAAIFLAGGALYYFVYAASVVKSVAGFAIVVCPLADLLKNTGLSIYQAFDYDWVVWPQAFFLCAGNLSSICGSFAALAYPTRNGPVLQPWNSLDDASLVLASFPDLTGFFAWIGFRSIVIIATDTICYDFVQLWEIQFDSLCFVVDVIVAILGGVVYKLRHAASPTAAAAMLPLLFWPAIPVLGSGFNILSSVLDFYHHRQLAKYGHIVIGFMQKALLAVGVLCSYSWCLKSPSLEEPTFNVEGLADDSSAAFSSICSLFIGIVCIVC